jgi:hypothetical protein
MPGRGFEEPSEVHAYADGESATFPTAFLVAIGQGMERFLADQRREAVTLALTKLRREVEDERNRVAPSSGREYAFFLALIDKAVPR